jgi:TPP-dependent trihydroxycyclohexane-1,2-dione (THcHDO) dehydratase
MNAFFDESNTLQFYSRNKIYNNLDVDWQFFYDTEMSGASVAGLPNIQSLSKQEIASANEVQILWSSPVTSNYLGNSTFIWNAPTNFLGAGGLRTKIESNTSPADTVLDIDLNTYADVYSNAQSLYSFSGYVLINSEVIEYDAIQYQYVEKDAADDAIPEKVWITSPLDLNKYRWLSKVGYKDPKKPETAFFKPTGKYRVKTRGALGTSRADHPASAIDFVNKNAAEDLTKWNQKVIEFK